MQTLEQEQYRHGVRRRDGFTMVELMAVFAVLGVLGAVVGTGVLERIRVAHQEAEHTSLDTLVQGFQEHAARTKRLPGAEDWAPCLAGHLWVGVNRVTENAVGRSRLFFYDPDFRLGPGRSDPPPYIQTSEGSDRPLNPRVIILSSLGDSLPGMLLNRDTFANLWNTASNGIPEGWAGYWRGNGSDLQIARLDLTGLFHRVVLENRDEAGGVLYSVETNTPVAVPPGGRREFWLIDTSALNFHGSDGAVKARELIIEDTCYAFEDGSWSRSSSR